MGCPLQRNDLISQRKVSLADAGAVPWSIFSRLESPQNSGRFKLIKIKATELEREEHGSN
jgi:hypothetical protein